MLLEAEEGCDEWSQEVTLFVDGELDDVDRAAFQTHADSCPPCRAAVRFQGAFRNAIRTKLQASEVAPVIDLKSRIRVAIAEEPPPLPQPEPAPRARFPLKRFFSPVPVAAAGATALGIAAWFGFSRNSDDVVKDLVARHARQLPLEVQSSDPRALEQWLNGKVDFRVKVPKPVGKPLALVGARLSHVRDQAAVHLLYGTTQSPQHQVSMLVYDDTRGTVPTGSVRKVDDRDVYMANRAGYNVAIWKENEVVYSLVSDTEDDVLELVRATTQR